MCQRQGVQPEGTCQRTFTARGVDGGDQSGEALFRARSIGVEHGPEFRL